MKGAVNVILAMLVLMVLEAVLFPIIWIFVRFLNTSFCGSTSPLDSATCTQISQILLTIPLLMVVMLILTLIGGVGIAVYFVAKGK